MKYIKEINENFKLFDLGNHHWFGDKDHDDYGDRVQGHCLYIMERELCVSEKAFGALDRVREVFEKAIKERAQEYDAIVHNCRARNMRPEYSAETIYHTILQGRVDMLKERDWVNGGFKME